MDDSVRKVYIFDKSILSNIANDGCCKRAIKLMSSKIALKNKWIKQDNLNINMYDEKFISEKLNIPVIPTKNIVPLVSYQANSICAEIAILYKLLNSSDIKIYTCEEQGKDTKVFREKIYSKENITEVYNYYLQKIDEANFIEDNENIDRDNKTNNKYEYKVEDDIASFNKIIKVDKVNYIYQMKFFIKDPYAIMKKFSLTNANFYKEINIEFEAFKPDFIKVLDKTEKYHKDNQTVNYKVLNDNFEIIESKNDKYKLQVCDVKMSNYRDSFCTEIGIYIVALNQFLNENGLNSDYEVVASGIIFSEYLKELLINKLNPIDIKEIYFENSRQNLDGLFKNKLPAIIEIIESANTNIFNTVKMNHSCETCDYYGGYYAGRIEVGGKNISLRDKSREEIKDIFENPNNDFCTEIERRKKSINVLPTISGSERSQLIENQCLTYNSIDVETLPCFAKKNISIISKTNKILADVKLKKSRIINDDGKLISKNKNYIYSEKTSNACKIPLNNSHGGILNFYIDAKSDSQDIGLCFGVGYELIEGWGNRAKRYIDKNDKQVKINYQGKGWTGYPTLNYCEESDFKNQINNKHNVQVYIIDNIKYEKYKFLELLIDINETITFFENKRNDDNLSVAIYYWNERTIRYFRKLFMENMEVIVPRGKDIDKEILREICGVYYTDQIVSKVSSLYRRLRGLFTIEKRDQVYIADRLIFNLKTAIEDVYVLNNDFNNTLYGVHKNLNNVDPMLVRENYKYMKFFKKHTDELHGGVLPKFHKGYQNSATKDRYRTEIINMLKCRLYTLAEVRHTLKNSQISIEPRLVSSIDRTNVECNKLKLGNLLYLFNKLQVYAEKTEIEDIHAQEMYEKVVVGNSVKLLREIRGKERENICIKEGIVDIYNENYKVYEVANESIYADYNENDFLAIIYPENCFEYIYSKFTNDINRRFSSIYISDDELFRQIKSKFFRTKFGKDDIDEQYSSLYSYKNIINTEVKIVKFNRTELYLIIQLKPLALNIFNYLQDNPQLKEVQIFDKENGTYTKEIKKIQFNFKENLILEKEAYDFWLSNLKKSLLKLEDNPDGIELLENFSTIAPSKQTIKEEKEKIKSRFTDEIEDDKLEAMANSMTQRLNLLWGPPGTGKTYTIAKIILNYILEQQSASNLRILLMGNYYATKNILKEILNTIDSDPKLKRLSKDICFKRYISDDRINENLDKRIKYITKDNVNGTVEMLESKKAYNIITITPQQIYKFFIKGTNMSRSKKKTEEQVNLLELIWMNGMDFIIVDEASQMDVGHFIPGLLMVKKHTKMLLSGDHKQLSPIIKVKLGKAEERFFDSILNYYLKEYESETINIRRSLEVNRRSNEIIVEGTKFISDYFEGYRAYEGNRYRKIKFKNEFEDKVLDPNNPIVLIKYDDGKSGRVNLFELESITKLVKVIWDNIKIEEGEKLITFFNKILGIVVTHTAQRVMLQNRLIEMFDSEVKKNPERTKEIEDTIRACVDTVDRYQGQEREIVIASFVVGNKELINKEAEFLYNPNRLNVMLSRARSKFILFVANELLQNNPSDYDRLEDQRAILKLNEFCKYEEEILGNLWTNIKLRIRYRPFNI